MSIPIILPTLTTGWFWYRIYKQGTNDHWQCLLLVKICFGYTLNHAYGEHSLSRLKFFSNTSHFWMAENTLIINTVQGDLQWQKHRIKFEHFNRFIELCKWKRSVPKWFRKTSQLSKMTKQLRPKKAGMSKYQTLNQWWFIFSAKRELSTKNVFLHDKLVTKRFIKSSWKAQKRVICVRHCREIKHHIIFYLKRHSCGSPVSLFTWTQHLWFFPFP